MNIFSVLTPLVYWLLIGIWTFIFVFYLRKLFIKERPDKFLQLLLLILAIDAFRTLFESLYFGARFTSLSGLLPISIYDFLIQPQIVFFPKLINLLASFFVILIIVRKWLPQEVHRIDVFNTMLKERTKLIEATSQKYQNEAQEALVRAEYYRKTTINSPLPIMIHANDGTVMMISDSWTKITGYTLDEINTIEKWVKHAYVSDALKLSEYIRKLYKIDEPVREGCFTICTKNGEKRIWDFSSAPLDVLPNGKRLIITTAIDITEKSLAETELNEHRNNLEELIKNRTNELEEKAILLNRSQKALTYLLEDVNEIRKQLEVSNTKLQDSNSELEAFSYSVSHDLRAPLRGIHGFTQILMEDYADTMDDEFKRICSVIWDNSQKMGHLIDDLLAFSRLSRIEMQASPLDMGGMVNSIYHELADEEMRQRIDLSIDDIPGAYGDATLIKQVWINLISNAIKFTAKREKSIISVTCNTQDDKNIYCVSDNGAGFDMKYIDKLFGVFQRLHSMKEFDGTGVGLAIVQRIVLRHGGKVWAKGEVDRGAQFYFSMPINKIT